VKEHNYVRQSKGNAPEDENSETLSHEEIIAESSENEVKIDLRMTNG
jgi:hypothetical protein